VTEGTIILFGATGDLSKRRIIPALYTLFRDKKVENFKCIGVAYESTTKEEVLQASKPYVESCNEELWNCFSANFYYLKVDVTQQSDFVGLADFIASLEQKNKGVNNRLLYLALPPQLFVTVTEQCAYAGIINKMHDEETVPWRRIVYEKPFGSDFQSALLINKTISHYLEEFQIFRVDHYLAKDIVGTLALVRFTNRIFEPLWNAENIDWVEIELSETSDIGNRGYYYDSYGALKDVVQNHILQIIALLAMESPQSLSGDFIRDKKAEILQKIRCSDGILGQYRGYREEKNVQSDSTTETFAALQLFVDTDRWKKVPWYIRTGKCLTKKETVITIQFKSVACLLTTSCPSESNCLTIRVMPEPGFAITLNVKKPGPRVEVMPVAMDFCYECKFGTVVENVYEFVLQEVLHGEQSISVRFDEIEYAWQVIDQIKRLNLPLCVYQKESQGPHELQIFAEKNKMKWRL